MINDKPLTLEQLRQMDGQPAYWLEDESWGIISVDSVGPWANIPFFRGRKQGVNFEYDIEAREMEVYASPTLIVADEQSELTKEQYNWLMQRFLRKE